MTKKNGFHLFFETSAKTGENIEKTFIEAAELINLNYITKKNKNLVQPKPILINKSLGLFLFATMCLAWLFFPYLTKTKGVFISLLYWILEYSFIYEKNSMLQKNGKMKNVNYLIFIFIIFK